MECDHQQGSHVSQGHVHVEILDPATGQPQPPGEVGEVVCTVLQRRASPLIRFRTQDLAYIDPQPCECGINFPRIHIRGRMVDQLPGGQQAAQQISPYMIEDVLFAHNEVGGNYQIYTGGAKLQIEAELRPGMGDGDAAKAAIEQTLSQRGVQSEVAWVPHVPRTGGKTRRIRPLAERDELMNQASMLQPKEEGHS